MNNKNWLDELAEKNKNVKQKFDIKTYHNILHSDIPDFLLDYIKLPLLQRLNGIGLLCGTDWTPLFCNKTFYSRLNHSVGVALVVWHFTQDKKQTIAALLHDVSTPTFSHVTDFRNGDALTQQSTELLNSKMILENKELATLLKKDSILPTEIDDYHKYPVADNEMPGLSADRLEYMYPSGAILNGVWNLDEIKQNYNQIAVLKNESKKDELGFLSLEEACKYTKKFCEISLILQRNEDKVSMQLLADVLTCALKCNFATEKDFYTVSEKDLIQKFDSLADKNVDKEFTKLFHTFRKMTKVLHTNEPLLNSYCVCLSVKQRYVNPLVKVSDNCAKRVSTLDKNTDSCIKDFLSYKDSLYGCVPWIF